LYKLYNREEEGEVSIPQKIIKVLRQYEGQTLTKATLYELAWGQEYDESRDSNTLRANVCYARKIASGIETVRGVGYRMEVKK
jgi:DNA-binding response OmpR family regulator